MNKHTFKRFVVQALILMLSVILTGTYGQKSASATCESKNGLHVAKFTTPEGDIAIYFPGDVSAGDRICGTVISKPTGKNEKKMEKNKGVLEGYVFEMQEDETNTTGAKGNKFLWLVPAVAGEIIHLVMKDPGGNTIATAEIPVNPEPPDVHFPATITPGDYALPSIIQSGMPSTIAGHFDSDISNTAVQVGSQSTMILAESPRQCTFMAPENIVGPSNISLNEGNVAVQGKTNSLDLNLTANKLALNKGESTTIHLVITGLQGTQQPVPFEITNHSPETVSLSGGNEQNLEIEPSQIPANGTYSQDFTVSALSTGSFTLVAQVTPPEPGLVMLVSPQGEIDANSMRFEWSTLNVPSDATFTLKLWQVMEYTPGMEPAAPAVSLETLKQTAPYYSQDGLTGHSFDYGQVSFAPLEPGYMYAWQVSALCADGSVIESLLENLFCCGIKDWEHIKTGVDKTKYLPKDKAGTHTVHIEKGNNRTSYYDPNIPDGYEHVTTGNDISVVIPKGWQHVDKTGPDQTRYYPPNLIHQTTGPDKTSYIPNGSEHIEKGADASKYKPLNSEHITAGADATKYSTKIHVDIGPNPSTYQPGAVLPADPKKPGEGDKPIKPKTMDDIKKEEKAKVDKEAQDAKKKIDEEAKKAKEQIDKEAKEKSEEDRKQK